MDLTPEERNERLAAEERHLQDRLSSKEPQVVTSSISKEQEDHMRRLEMARDRLEVVLVNSHNTGVVLQRELFPLDKGRIPIREICKRWKIKNPMWADMDESIGEMPDGYSDTTFAGFKSIRIRGTVVV